VAGRLVDDPALSAMVFVVIDFEGDTPAGARPEPIEVAALFLEYGDDVWLQAGRYASLIRPPVHAPVTGFDTGQTGITAAMVADGTAGRGRCWPGSTRCWTIDRTCWSPTMHRPRPASCPTTAGCCLTPSQASEVGSTWVSKADLLADSDVLTIHLKLSDRTRGLLAIADLAAMKPTRS